MILESIIGKSHLMILESIIDKSHLMILESIIDKSHLMILESCNVEEIWCNKIARLKEGHNYGMVSS